MTGIADIERTGNRSYKSAPPMVIDADKSYTATMKTDKGDIVIELAAKDAPNPANNSVYLSQAGYYDSLSFYRVIANFGQGGGPVGNGTSGRLQVRRRVQPQVAPQRPACSRWPTPAPGTNGSQFFIRHAAQPHLDDRHSVFGKVTSGIDVVNNIRQGDKISASISKRSNPTTRSAETARPISVDRLLHPPDPSP